jgi:hypothetical protein
MAPHQVPDREKRARKESGTMEGLGPPIRGLIEEIKHTSIEGRSWRISDWFVQYLSSSSFWILNQVHPE